MNLLTPAELSDLRLRLLQDFSSSFLIEIGRQAPSAEYVVTVFYEDKELTLSQCLDAE